MFSYEIWEILKTPILKNICKRLLLFVSSQNTITNSGGEFGLDETSDRVQCKYFLNITVLLNQIQAYNLYIS